MLREGMLAHQGEYMRGLDNCKSRADTLGTLLGMLLFVSTEATWLATAKVQASWRAGFRGSWGQLFGRTDAELGISEASGLPPGIYRLRLQAKLDAWEAKLDAWEAKDSDEPEMLQSESADDPEQILVSPPSPQGVSAPPAEISEDWCLL